MEPDLGPVPGRDYGPFMQADDEEIVWPSKDKIEDEADDGGGPSTAAWTFYHLIKLYVQDLVELRLADTISEYDDLFRF